jgi:thioredoxin 1
MSEIIFTDQNFEQEVLKSDKPVLIDFWAEWCGPCRMQVPVIEELAKDFKGKAKVGRLDVDQNPAISQKHNVMSIPTLMIFNKGEVVWQTAGLQQKKNLEDELKKLVGK